MTSMNRLLWTAAVASLVGVLVACAAPEDTTAEPAAAEAVATTAAATTAAASASPVESVPPTIEKRTVVERKAIPFPRKTVKDPTLASGTRKVRRRGVAGLRTLTYEVTLTGGVQTARKLVRSVVTKQPVAQVTAVGTKEQSQCDPNYSGCVPIASDVDCAGGSGNGPEYVAGPVKVIGFDKYGLDNDSDGYGCED